MYRDPLPSNAANSAAARSGAPCAPSGSGDPRSRRSSRAGRRGTAVLPVPHRRRRAGTVRL